MIEYGVALLVVCALSLYERRAAPYALLLLSGWLLGFGPAETWPVISILSGLCFVWLLRKDGPPWAWVAACCVPPMLLCDAAYFWLLDRGSYHGDTYAFCLNMLFSVQLLAIGWPGARNATRSLVLRCHRIDRRVMGRVFASRVVGQGSERGR